MPKLAVVYVTDEYPTASQTFVYREAVAASEQGVEIAVFPLQLRPEGNRYPITVIAASRRVYKYFWPVLRSLGRPIRAARVVSDAIRAGRPSLIARAFYAAAQAALLISKVEGRVHILHAHFAARCADVARYAAMLSRSRLLFTVTIHAAEIYVPESLQLLRRRIRASDHLIAENEHGLDHLRSLGIYARGASVVHGAVDERDVRARPPRLRRSAQIVTIGRFVDKKGWWTAAQAAVDLEKNGFDFEWTFVGSGPLEARIAQFLRTAGCSRVSMTGARSNDESLKILAAADLFVLPCETAPSGEMDGIPNVLLEAMVNEVPVVTTPTAGIPELVEHGVTGVLVPPRDPVAVADAVVKLWRNDSLRTALARAALAKVRSQFYTPTEAAKLVSVWEALAGEIVTDTRI